MMTTALGVTGWRDALSAGGKLSTRFAHRYAILLSDAERYATGARRARAQVVAVQHPLRALSILLGIDQWKHMDLKRDWGIVHAGTDAKFVESLVSTGDLDATLVHCADLEQTWVPLHPDRHAKLLIANDRALVALRWPASTLQSRSGHQTRVAEVAKAASRSAGMPVEVWDDYSVCDSAAEHVWVFTSNLGVTVEDRLRTLPYDAPERRVLVHGVAALREAMLEAGVIWQGFAPRNMFFTDGRLLLIDFEETITAADDPARAAECLLWHRVFFADCLSDEDKALIFHREPNWLDDLAPDLQLPADSFESALLGVQTVSWSTRVQLLTESARLEAAHVRPEPCSRGTLLFGHELGHFWGDFVRPHVEVEIFRGLVGVHRPNDLTAALEVFEAAMEADILRMLLSRAGGSCELSTPYTDAAAGCLTDTGAAPVADVRKRKERGWHEQLDADPRALMDDVLFGLQVVPGISAEPVFIGVPGGEPHTRQALEQVVAVGARFTHRHDHGEPVVRYADNDTLQTMFEHGIPLEGCDFPGLLDEIERTAVRYSILQSHPGYLAFPDSANALGAVAGGILGRLLNQNLIAVDRSAPAATFVEIQTIAWLRELVGYSTKPLTQMRGVKDVGGLWTTGGHLSNHVAMLAALGAQFPQARRCGLRALESSPAVIMAGPIAHYSHSDAAFHLGLGWDAIMAVDAQRGYTTDIDAVEKALAGPPTGQTPFMVVGVAGNCRTTGLDDLAGLAEVCRRYGVWFHVDACHGGSLIFSQGLRARHLSGIDLADSISLDPHKGLFTPYPSSYVLFRDPPVLTQFSRHEATVVRDDSWDLGLITPFLGSRGFESLATWMMLRHIGVRRLGKLVEGRQALVRYLARRIDAAGLFIALNDVDFYRLAFVLCPPEARAIIATLDEMGRQRAGKAVSAFTSELNTVLYQHGEVCFDEHTLADLGDRIGAGAIGNYTVMATCPGNPGLTQADLDRAIDRLIDAARPIATRLIAYLREEINTAPVHGHGGPAGWSD